MNRGKLAIGAVVVGTSIGLFVLTAVSLSRTSRASAAHEQAVTQLRRGQYEMARESFERALAIRPDEPTFLANYGVCLEALGLYEDATDVYHRSLEIDNDPEVLFKLGRATCLAGDPERGVNTMWQAHSLVMLTQRQAGDMGLCLQSSGRPEQAIPYLEQGLLGAPDDPELRAALEQAQSYRVVAP